MHKIDPMVAAVLFRDVLQKCHRPDIRATNRPRSSIRRAREGAHAPRFSPGAAATGITFLCKQWPQSAGAERDFEDFDTARGPIKRILDRLREQWAHPVWRPPHRRP